ncbi:hypothetical protein Hanom_Chr12g01099331 [Helianthus anomalus]
MCCESKQYSTYGCILGHKKKRLNPESRNRRTAQKEKPQHFRSDRRPPVWVVWPAGLAAEVVQHPEPGRLTRRLPFNTLNRAISDPIHGLKIELNVGIAHSPVYR